MNEIFQAKVVEIIWKPNSSNKYELFRFQYWLEMLGFEKPNNIDYSFSWNYQYKSRGK